VTIFNQASGEYQTWTRKSILNKEGHARRAFNEKTRQELKLANDASLTAKKEAFDGAKTKASSTPELLAALRTRMQRFR